MKMAYHQREVITNDHNNTEVELSWGYTLNKHPENFNQEIKLNLVCSNLLTIKAITEGV